MSNVRKVKKIKISHTIDKKYIDLIDSEIKSKRFGSRSHAIEYALQTMLDKLDKEGEKYE